MNIVGIFKRAGARSRTAGFWALLRQLRSFGALLGLAALVAASCAKSVTQPVLINNPPVVDSVTTSATSVAFGDSVTLTTFAHDVDGDSLVYDWDTDIRVLLKGALPGEFLVVNARDNHMVCYPNYRPSQIDTLWVVCSTRDRRGGGASRVASFMLHP